MKTLLATKVGMIAVAVFVLGMAFVFYRVADRRKARKGGAMATVAASSVAPLAPVQPSFKPVAPAPPPPSPSPSGANLAENAAYLDQYYQLEGKLRPDRDRQGNPMTRRATAGTPAVASRAVRADDDSPPAPPPGRASLRLQGRTATAARTTETAVPPPHLAPPAGTTAAPKVSGAVSDDEDDARPGAIASRSRPKRFNPYGSVIRCELVFTIDSTNEQTPLIGVVMEPVYNNGQLVVPAGAELHGIARPDRLRDRIFSGEAWVLVFPREAGRPNGRQLSVIPFCIQRYKN